MVYPGFIVALSIDKLQFNEFYICKPSYTCFSLAIFIKKVFFSSKWTYQTNCLMINYYIWFCKNNMWRQQSFIFFLLHFLLSWDPLVYHVWVPIGQNVIYVIKQLFDLVIFILWKRYWQVENIHFKPIQLIL